jgi:hypothetical protein
LSAAVALAVTGCGQGGGTAPTAPTPPDALTVTVDGSGYAGFRIDLACAVADRPACAAVLDALRDADTAARCEPLDGDRSTILVRGDIEGEPVAASLARRTTCEARAYDRVIEALGL